MRWPIANRALLTLRSRQFCPLGPLHRLPIRRDYDHSKRLNSIRSSSKSATHGRVFSPSKSSRKPRHRERRAQAPSHAPPVVPRRNGGSAQNHGRSALQPFREDTSKCLLESEIEFSLKNLQQTVQLHTQKDLDRIPGGSFRRPWKAVCLAVEHLGGTQSVEESRCMNPSSGEKFFRATVTINLPGDKNLVAAGDGSYPEHALHAANLHALAKMRDMGLLVFGRDQAKEESSDEKEGMLDVYNYAARHRCIPKVSCEQQGRAYNIVIDMPEHAIHVTTWNVRGIDNAERAAARAFKKQAELYHLRMGADTVVVRDRYALSTDNATDFYIFCRDSGENFGNFDVEMKQDGNIWMGRPVLKHLDLDPALEVKTRSKIHTAKIASLIGALSIVNMKPHLLDGFSKALRAGNGHYLPRLKAEEVVLSPEVLQELNEVQALQWPFQTRSAAQSNEEPVRPIRPKHALTPDQLATKSSRLQEILKAYKTRPDLQHLRQTRSELPMTQYASHVSQIVHDNVYCVIIGATGSGKTTQVPQILFDQAIESGTGASCNIICTQPRRIAATSVARRVAAERAERLQDTVGYHVRFDAKQPTPGGSILYCTTGILLQQLQHAPDDVLDHVSHLVIDEVHERDIIIDFLLITLKNTMAARAAQGKKLPRIVLMSATIDAEQFAEYFRDSLPSEESTDCPTLRVPGRTFPVQEYYLDTVLEMMRDCHGENTLQLLRADKDTAQYLKAEKSRKGDVPANIDTSTESVIDWKRQAAPAGGDDSFHADNKDDALVPLGLTATTVAHITKTSESGAILVFLPGMDEIIGVDKLLRARSPLGVDFNDTQRFQVIMLHSSIQDSQKTVFDPVPEGCRKIILSTNIAETSVTIPDVQFVVDTGKSREKRYDQTRRITQLQCTWISKSNAKQRAGRAGRVQDGVYYALFTRSRRESMRAVGLPELLRSDLQETCLDVKVQAFKMPVADFLAGAIEPPAPSAVDIAMQNLVSLGALTEDEKLTPLGRILASLPVHPTLGKMIVLGIIFRCLDPMITLGAAAHQPPFFITPLGQRSTVLRVKKKFAGPSESDHIMLLKTFNQARQASARHYERFRTFASDNFIHQGVFRSIDLTARDIEKILIDAKLIQSYSPTTSLQYGGHEMNENSASIPLIKALLTAGLYPNFAVYTAPRNWRTSVEKHTMVHPSSVNYGTPLSDRFLTFNSLSLSNSGVSMFLRETSSVTPLTALLFGGPLVRDGPILDMDSWLPMMIKAAVPGSKPDARRGGGLVSSQVMFLRSLLDRMLASALGDLAVKTTASDDRMRRELASRLVRILSREAETKRNLPRADPRWEPRNKRVNRDAAPGGPNRRGYSPSRQASPGNTKLAFADG